MIANANVIFETERCKGCDLCSSVCPKHIVTLSKSITNRKGYPVAGVANLSQCIACGNCAKICPDSVITVEKEN